MRWLKLRAVAAVTQLVEFQPSKLTVVGSSPICRSFIPPPEQLQAYWADPADVNNNLLLTQWIAQQPWARAYATFLANGAPDASYLATETRRPPPYAELADLPEGTLGREFVRWYETHDIPLDAQALWEVTQVGPWPVARFTKVHDLQHLITGLPPTLLGEMQLAGVLFGARRPGLFALLNHFGHPLAGWRKGAMWESMRAYQAGRLQGWFCGSDLLMFPYERFWEEQLLTCRQQLGIPLDGFPSYPWSPVS